MRTVLGHLCAHNALTPQHVRCTDSFCQLPLSFHYCLTSSFSSVATMLSGPVLLPCFRATEESERRQRSTRIRLLIASRNRVLWREGGVGFASWQVATEETETYPGAPNPSAIRHTSVISNQLSVPETGRCSAARCLSMSFIVPFPSLVQPSATDGLRKY